MSSGWKLVLGLVAFGGWTFQAQAAGPATVCFDEPAKPAPRAASLRMASSRQGAAPLPSGVPQGAPAGPAMGGPMAADRFNSWFNAYRGFQGGRARLGTAESGDVELATGELTAEVAEAGEATDVMEFGALPRGQVRTRRPGVGRSISSGGAWFSSGSPFGIKFGYGSGFGYGGYGFDNPYGYGSRTGGGGAYGYGFGPFGSVGGQTGERLSGLISGGGGVEPGRLISSEPGAIGAPGQLERGAVGGTFGRSGAGARRLGGSASESGARGAE
jgi:hypothetical protein